jgi:hypothetical protein
VRILEERVMAALLTVRLPSPHPTAEGFRPGGRLSSLAEWLLLVWMFAVVAFFGLIGAGAAGLLR